LQAELEAKGKLAALEIVRNIVSSHVKVLFVRQSSPLGLEHTVLCAAPMIGEDDPFAVLLPDDLIDGYPEGALKQMLPTAIETDGSVVAVEQVAKENVSKYGIVDMMSGKTAGSLASKLKGIVEKPSIEQAPPTNAVVGRYILHSSVLKKL
jgi:UTP--glucose-1-phosphate uridylyltransferase